MSEEELPAGRPRSERQHVMVTPESEPGVGAQGRGQKKRRTAEFGDSRLPARFWDKVIASPSGCWVWAGANNGFGYGQFGIRSGHQLTHRVAYRALVGPIPKKLQIDHLCRNRGCCNPAHLEPVTALVNARRGIRGRQLRAYMPLAAAERAKTHCPRGHAYSPENTYVTPRGHRQCRSCKVAAKARFDEHRKELQK